MPSKYIIHTVGSVWNSFVLPGIKQDRLRDCYNSCLFLAERQGLKFIVFPCIFTGAYCFSKDIEALVAIFAIKDF